LLAGPTGVGKTECAIDLAHRLGGEIINADSMQVYRCMDIGTAKPSAAQRARVPHHLLDVVDPDEPFDAAQYLQQAQPVIEALHGRGKMPLVVGGTGLYMKVLTRGICPVPPGDPAVKRQLLQELESAGPARLHGKLLQIDAESARRIHSNDRQRIVRALEVFRVTGKPLSHWQAGHGFREPLYRTLKLFLSRPREELYRRIDARVETMMAEGFLDEVRGLLARAYSPRLKSMQSLGYRQLISHLQGKYSLPEAVHDIQRDTRRYAKRQITWFRADAEFIWCLPDEQQQILDMIAEHGCW
jgi:tRNA dimethylallyltransferase